MKKTRCTPAAGWERGQVENQVGTIRERWFTPRLRFASYVELNAWLLDQGVPLAHGVAHRLPGGRRTDPLPPRLPPHRRPQPDPRQRPRARRHAPDRSQDPRHLRPLQHHQRTGTPRGRGPTGRLSGAAGAGAPRARALGQHRRPAHRAAPSPRATHHRVRAHGAPPRPRLAAASRGRGWPDTARLCASAPPQPTACPARRRTCIATWSPRVAAERTPRTTVTLPGLGHLGHRHEFRTQDGSA